MLWFPVCQGQWVELIHSKSKEVALVKAFLMADGRLEYRFQDDDRNFQIERLRRRLEREARINQRVDTYL